LRPQFRIVTVHLAQPAAGLTPGLKALGQLDFFAGCQQGDAGHLFEVEADGIVGGDA